MRTGQENQGKLFVKSNLVNTYKRVIDQELQFYFMYVDLIRDFQFWEAVLAFSGILFIWHDIAAVWERNKNKAFPGLWKIYIGCYFFLPSLSLCLLVTSLTWFLYSFSIASQGYRQGLYIRTMIKLQAEAFYLFKSFNLNSLRGRGLCVYLRHWRNSRSSL